MGWPEGRIGQSAPCGASGTSCARQICGPVMVSQILQIAFVSDPINAERVTPLPRGRIVGHYRSPPIKNVNVNAVMPQAAASAAKLR